MEDPVKYLKISSVLALLLAFLPLLAFGAEQHKNISLLEGVQVNGQKLKPGSYQLRFDDANPNTQVQFVRYGKTVMTAPAQVEHQKKQVKDEDYEFNNNNGQHNLDRVYVNSDEALVFSDNGSPSASASSQNANPPSQ